MRMRKINAYTQTSVGVVETMQKLWAVYLISFIIWHGYINIQNGQYYTCGSETLSSVSYFSLSIIKSAEDHDSSHSCYILKH